MDEKLRLRRRELIVSGQLKRPIIFKNQLKNWNCHDWDLNAWAKHLQQKKIKFRVGPVIKTSGCPVWENQCEYVEATVDEFLDIGKKDNENSGPFDRFPPTTHWAYADYKYMAELFPPEHPVNRSVDWSWFGFEGRTGAESTFWLGSNGAHTPCHYDTYGCNLVAQLIGRKRWVLFPPTDTDCLYPTRIPYEESSVFSSVNICRPNLSTHPRFKLARPWMVTLSAGDALYVPPRWWHFVQSITDHTLSINSWIELDCDEERRLEEAVTKEICTDFTLAHQIDSVRWLNPTEDFSLPSRNLSYIEMCLKNVKRASENVSDTNRMEETHQLDTCFGKENYQEVRPMKFQEYLSQVADSKSLDESVSKHSDESLSTCEDVEIRFLNALLHPDVIDLICQKLKVSS